MAKPLLSTGHAAGAQVVTTRDVTTVSLPQADASAVASARAATWVLRWPWERRVTSG